MDILIMVFLGVGTIIIAICLYFVAVAALPGLGVPGQPLEKAERGVQISRGARP